LCRGESEGGVSPPDEFSAHIRKTDGVARGGPGQRERSPTREITSLPGRENQDRAREAEQEAGQADRVECAVSTEGEADQQRVLDLADLADEPWVGAEWAGACLEIMLEACAAAGFSPKFAVESDDYTTAQGFVAAGLGVGLIPRMGLGNRHPAVVRRVRKPEPVRAIYAAVRETSLTQPALRGLLDALREAAAP
jgi:DNA-binding transcriptional LysR family regulator